MLDLFAKKESPMQGMMGLGGGVPSRLLTLASGETTYIEDVFNTYLITGTGSAQTINAGIDFSGEGGLVWFKNRDSSSDRHVFCDTERGGPAKVISSDRNNAEISYGTNVFGGFTSTGYITGDAGMTGGSGEDAVYWGFRKCPGFFDIVTYTGNGSYGHDISHNLGSVPGSIFVKRLDTASHWTVYHRGIDSSAPENYKIYLDEDGERIDNDWLTDTAPTATQFRLGSESATNANGGTYVAYLFAHNDGSFGEASDEAVIKCEGYVGNGSSGHEINVGFEPQWLMIKRVTGGTQNWRIFDSMRGIYTGGNDSILFPNHPTDEQTSSDLVDLTPTGFKLIETNSTVNRSGDRYIYIAIRRPHKPPEAGTDVLAIDPYSGSTTLPFVAPFAPDLAFIKNKSSSGDWFWADRQRLSSAIRSNSSNSEQTASAYTVQFRGAFSSSWGNYIGYMFKRAPGFFDLVSFKGNSSSTQNVSHNLGVVPEMMILKNRQSNFDWNVYHASLGNSKALVLNDNSVGHSSTNAWNNTTPTASVFSVGDNAYTNQGNQDVVAFLFASKSGISKVGTYSGSSSSINVDCGFTNGARFIMIKRTDDTGNWMLFDTERGINSGNDPYLRLNSTDAQDSSYDAIDTLASGFTVNSGNGNYNTNGGSYIFLAIA